MQKNNQTTETSDCGSEQSKTTRANFAFSIALPSLLTALVYYFTNPKPQAYYDYTFRIAENFLKGKIGLPYEDLPWLNELIPLDDKFYSAFPLGSVLSMLPFAWLKTAGLVQEMPAALIVALQAGAICFFLLLIAAHYEIGRAKKILMTAGILYGTWMWTNLAFGSAWLLALGFAMLGELGAIYFTIYRPRPFVAGIFYALAFGNRTEILLIAPIFLLLLRPSAKTAAAQSAENESENSQDGSENLQFNYFKSVGKSWALFCIAPFLLGAWTLVYNDLRFDSPFDFGYARIPGVLDEPWYANGIFSILYIPRQASDMLFKFWKSVPQFPYLLPDGFGNSILPSSPFLFLLLRRGFRHQRIKEMAWSAIVILTLLLWTHGNSGGWQFAYRYAMVLLPWIFVVLLENTPEKTSRLERLLYASSIFINACVSYLYFFTDYIKP